MFKGGRSLIEQMLAYFTRLLKDNENIEDACRPDSALRALEMTAELFSETNSSHGPNVPDAVKSAFCDTVAAMQTANEAGVTNLHPDITDEDRREHAQMIAKLQKIVSILQQALAHVTEHLPTNAEEAGLWLEQMDQIMSEFMFLSGSMLEGVQDAPAHEISEILVENLQNMQHQAEHAQKRHKSGE